MKEVVILIIVAISSLFILGYSIHMFIGGLVSPQTEKTAIITAVIIGAIVLAFLGLDIIRQRRKR
jgi:multisubunit Na+/H+ antiporter MnhB subunit